MAVYSVFKALGVDISVRPIYDLKNDYIFEDYDPDNPHSYDNYSMNEEESDRKVEKEDEDNVEKSFVGNSCGQVQLTEVGGYDASREEILAEANARWLKVKWLNKPASRDISFVHLTVSRSWSLNSLLITNARFSMETRPALMRCIRMPLWSSQCLRLLHARVLVSSRLPDKLAFFGSVRLGEMQLHHT